MSATLRTVLKANRLVRPAPLRTFHVSARRHDHYLDVDAEAFRKLTSSAQANSKVVLVDFYADWCGPCKMLSPLLEKITAEEDLTTGTGKKVDLVTVDIDQHTDLAQEFQVRSIPMVVAFQDGKPVSQFVGSIPEPRIRAFLQGL